MLKPNHSKTEILKLLVHGGPNKVVNTNTPEANNNKQTNKQKHEQCLKKHKWKTADNSVDDIDANRTREGKC